MVVEGLGERAGDGEGEETEVVGVEAAGGGAREAVGGAVVEARAADTAVELAEEADDARVRAAQRLGDEEDDGVHGRLPDPSDPRRASAKEAKRAAAKLQKEESDLHGT